MDSITFTYARYKSLKRAYNKAVKENADSFMWEGYELVTNYAKYLLEYLQIKFGNKEL